MDEEEAPKEKKVPEELTCPEWMMTMGDCMSLLLTFFVLLLTFSTTSKSRLMDVIGVMKGAFSFVDTQNLANKEHSAYNTTSLEDSEKEAQMKDVENSTNVPLSTLEMQHPIIKDFRQSLKEVGFENSLDLSELDQGIAIEVPVDEVFVGQSLRLTEKGRKLMDGVAEIAFNTIHEVRIVSPMTLTMKEAGKNRLSAKSVNAAKRIAQVVEFLMKNYSVKESRIGVSWEVFKSGTPRMSADTLKIVFIERLKINEKSIEEFIKEESN